MEGIFELVLKSKAILGFGIGFSMSQSPRGTNFQPYWSSISKSCIKSCIKTTGKSFVKSCIKSLGGNNKVFICYLDYY